MHDIPLNDTQRFFAEKNHNLVYKFLHEKNLPASEYNVTEIFIIGSHQKFRCSVQTTHTALDTNLRRIYRLLRNIFVKDFCTGQTIPQRPMYFPIWLRVTVP